MRNAALLKVTNEQETERHTSRTHHHYEQQFRKAVKYEISVTQGAF